MANILLGGSVNTTGVPILGSANVVFTSGDNTAGFHLMTVAEYANNYLNVTGTLTQNCNLFVPLPGTVGQEFVIKNNTGGGFSITIKVDDVLYSGIAIPDGYTYAVVCDTTLSFIQTGGNTAVGGSFTAGGDLAGSTTDQIVVSISGSGGTAAVNTNNLAFGAGEAAATIKQTTSVASAGSLTLQAQNAGSGNGGNLVLTSGTGAAAGNVLIETGGTNQMTVGPTGVTFINPVSFDYALTVSQLEGGSNAQFLISNLVGPAWVGMSQDISLTNTGVATVEGLYGIPMVNPGSPGFAQDGYVWSYNFYIDEFELLPQSGGTIFSGDLEGTGISQTVIGFDGKPLASSMLGPQVGNSIVWTTDPSPSWSASPIDLGGGIDAITGQLPTTPVVGTGGVLANIQGSSTDGYVLLTNNSSNAAWTQLYGDITVNSGAGNTMVTGIQGFHVDSTGPADADLLIYNALSFPTEWSATPVSGDVTLTNAGLMTVTAIQGSAISVTTPTSNQFLQYNSGTSKWTPTTVSIPSPVTWADDLSGSTNTAQYVTTISGSFTSHIVALGDGASPFTLATTNASVPSNNVSLTISAGAGVGAASQSGAGGNFSMSAGSAANATSGTSAGNNGGNFSIYTGPGSSGVGAGNNNGGVGGNLTFTVGSGGVATGAGLDGYNGSVYCYIGSALEFEIDNGFQSTNLLTAANQTTFTLGDGSNNVLIVSPVSKGSPTATTTIQGTLGNPGTSGEDGRAAGDGGFLTIVAGAGGDGGPDPNESSGSGGILALTAGNGGTANTTGDNGNGGNITLTPGVAGTGGSGSAGIPGLVIFGGGLSVQTNTISTSTYTVDSDGYTDYCIFCNLAGTINITLPVPTPGRTLVIKDIKDDAFSANITITQHASEKIDGSNTYVLNQNYASVHLTSDGFNWFVTAVYGT